MSVRALAAEVILYAVARKAVHDASGALKSFWDEHHGVPGMDQKRVKADGAKLLLNLGTSERAFVLAVLSLQLAWGAVLEEHAVIDKGIESPEAEKEWRAFLKWLLEGFFLFCADGCPNLSVY